MTRHPANPPALGDKKNQPGIQRRRRDDAKQTVFLEIANALSLSTDLRVTMTEVMRILHEKLGMERGTLTLLDPKTGELFIEIAHGLGQAEKNRGRYRVGEGITGKVVESGKPMVVPNAGSNPLFLNKTRARDLKRSNISFICVPIRLGQKTIGAMSVDRLFQENISLEEDQEVLTIISSQVAGAVRLHQKYQDEKDELTHENILLKQELKKKFHPANIIGESKRMADVYASIELVSQTRATVILRGESGTGKELVAHAIHYNSERSDGPFIKISCAALPETLLESELFGYEKGAFTGAAAAKAGRFEMAHEGTLFLDEIGDISPSTQVKLLRVIQEKEFERLGGTETIRVDIRLITATNKDLEAEVQAGRFREDLYYRLNVIPIFLPPLRERREDIPVLVKHFLEKSNRENRKQVRNISEAAMDYLVHYSWPGNVRELENAVERAVILCPGDTLSPELFPIPGVKKNLPSGGLGEGTVAVNSADRSLTEVVAEVERAMIAEALHKSEGNQRKAARDLGVTERILGYKIKTYGLK